MSHRPNSLRRPFTTSFATASLLLVLAVMLMFGARVQTALADGAPNVQAPGATSAGHGSRGLTVSVKRRARTSGKHVPASRAEAAAAAKAQARRLKATKAKLAREKAGRLAHRATSAPMASTTTTAAQTPNPSTTASGSALSAVPSLPSALPSSLPSTPSLGLVQVSDGSGELPSGAAMPTGDLPGWHQVFADDFNGNSLNWHLWGAYSGQPGGDPNGGPWSPSHVVVQNGELVLKGYEDNGHFTTGGVSSQPGLVQTYGKYLVRYRVDQGDGVSHCLLLWPASNVWGSEVDFSEDNGTDRQLTTATLHWGTGAPDQQTGQTHAVNMTQWHTLGVEWTPGKIVYTMDGQPWGSLQTSNVPNIPMALDMQTQTWCGAGQSAPNTWETCTSSSTPSEVDMDVDWVVAYAPSN